VETTLFDDGETAMTDARERGRQRAAHGLEALEVAGLDLAVDPGRDLALHLQLSELLARAIKAGAVPVGARLPSSRALSQRVGVSRNVVLAAYARLTEFGLVDGRHGSGSYVSAGRATSTARPVPAWLANADTPRPTASRTATALDLRLRARPAVDLPAAVWRRAWQGAALRRIPAGYGDPSGDRRLRVAVVAFANTARGLVAAPSDVVITNGAGEALRLLLHTVLHAGRRIAVEDPGYPAVRRIAHDLGAEVVDVPVDADGMRIDVLQRLDPPPQVVHLTPAHQFPTTVRLAPSRRAQLLAWARDHQVLVIDNDYGGEFDQPPHPPPLTATDPDGVVVHVGTLSRLHAPSLRIGYLVAPAPLAERIAAVRHDRDSYVSLPVQLAVADLLTSGELARQLRRARRVVTEQRRVLEHVPGLHGLRSGLHVALPLPDATAERSAAEFLAQRGIIVDRLSAFCASEARHGLLLDYAGVPPQTLARVADLLRGHTAPGCRGHSPNTAPGDPETRHWPPRAWEETPVHIPAPWSPTGRHHRADGPRRRPDPRAAARLPDHGARCPATGGPWRALALF
jgi:GntR family transcriptional regulator/MocR family aminotransferase